MPPESHGCLVSSRCATRVATADVQGLAQARRTYEDLAYEMAYGGPMGDKRVRRTVSLAPEVAAAMDAAVAAGEADTISGLMESAIDEWIRRREQRRVAADAACLDGESDIALISGAFEGPVWSGLRAR